MCMFALTVSIVEPKTIKEAMADSVWIEAMQEEHHQFDRLQVWELVDKPFGKKLIKLKWLWKNKKDGFVIRPDLVRLTSDSFVRTSNSAAVKHLITIRLTRYRNLSSGKALVNISANWYSVLTSFLHMMIDLF
ncbi:retrovirus-related pol polyprotein from transposon TNT 1-94 [Tanacetum coccineum]